MVGSANRTTLPCWTALPRSTGSRTQEVPAGPYIDPRVQGPGGPARQRPGGPEERRRGTCGAPRRHRRDALQHKVGKRLSAQVTAVSDALDRIEFEALAAHSREQHRVHVAPELLPGLADRLDALMQNSETLIDTLMTEIYVGFHELRLPVRAAPEVQGAPVAAPEAPLAARAPNAERAREKALADADAAFDKEFKEEYEYYFDQGALYECMRAGTEKMALNTAMLAGDWYKLRVESCERQIASLKEELAEKVYISKCERIEELLDINDAQADRIEALKVELRVAREREAVLRDVIRENCMSSASRASDDPPAATEGHV